MIPGWWWLSFALRSNLVLANFFCPGLIFADVIYPIFSCGEQFGCMWMYSGEGWEYQVRWIIRSYPCSWSTSHWIYPAFQVLAGPAFIITFTISGVLMGFLADRLSHISIHHHCQCYCINLSIHYHCHSCSYYINLFPGCQGHGCWARKLLSCSYCPHNNCLFLFLWPFESQKSGQFFVILLLSSHIFTTIHFTTNHFIATTTM